MVIQSAPGVGVHTKLPGPRAQALLEREGRYLARTYVKDYPLVVERASGMYLTDVDGNRFLDFAAGIAVCATGHCHPRVVAAIEQQARALMHLCVIDFSYPVVVDLAERLATAAPGPGDKQVFFANSGAEAIETSIKLARLYTGRQKVVAFYGSFHGRTTGAVSLTASKSVQRRGYTPLLPEVHHTHYATCYRCPVGREPQSCGVECLDLLTQTMFGTTAPPEDIAAIVVEPVLGEGGYYVPKAEFLVRLQALCREHGILLVFDEVQTGFGRTGKLFASEHFGLEPDVLVLAKGIASGLPLSAVVARTELMAWRSGGHGSTFGGNPVSCAAALATLDLLEGGLVENAARVGRHLEQRLSRLRDRNPEIGDVRGLGLMLAFDLVEDRSTRAPDAALRERLLYRCFEKGLVLMGCGASAVRLVPPLLVSEAEADTAVDTIEAALRELRERPPARS